VSFHKRCRFEKLCARFAARICERGLNLLQASGLRSQMRAAKPSEPTEQSARKYAGETCVGGSRAWPYKKEILFS
jgi:hypothetical protein